MLVKNLMFNKCIMNIKSEIICFVDGDLGAAITSERCYAKQLNRMLWERRHGPVGTGMKKDNL